MRFEIGARVKWKETCKIRLGFTLSDHGNVVRVQHLGANQGEPNIDVECDNGDVVHGIAEHWIEKVSVTSN